MQDRLPRPRRRPDAGAVGRPARATTGRGAAGGLRPGRRAARPLPAGQLTPPPARSDKRPPAAEACCWSAASTTTTSRTRTAGRRPRRRGGGGAEVDLGLLQGTEAERRLLEVWRRRGPKLTASLSGPEAATDRLRQELQAIAVRPPGHARLLRRQEVPLRPAAGPEAVRAGESPTALGERIGAGARSPLVLSGLVLRRGQPAGDARPRHPDRRDAIAGLTLDGLELAVLVGLRDGPGRRGRRRGRLRPAARLPPRRLQATWSPACGRWTTTPPPP